jgi:hypothetical protein
MEVALVAPQGQELALDIVLPHGEVEAYRCRGSRVSMRKAHEFLKQMRSSGFPAGVNHIDLTEREDLFPWKGWLCGREDLSKTLTTLPLRYAQDMAWSSLGRSTHSEQQSECSIFNS